MSEPTISSFSVTVRNPDGDHWDIYADRVRLFCIRGNPNDYYIRVENQIAVPTISEIRFKTVGACMAWICDALMGAE